MANVLIHYAAIPNQYGQNTIAGECPKAKRPIPNPRAAQRRRYRSADAARSAMEGANPKKRGGWGEGGRGPWVFLIATGGTANNFLFFIFYCPLPTHPLAFQYKTIWMRRSGAHPAAGGRYRGGAPPACHHTKFDVHLRLHYHPRHDLLLIPVRPTARGGH